MRQFIVLALCAITALGLIGCETTGGGKYEEQLVLQGMMYVGQPLRVRLTHTIPMGQSFNLRDNGVTGANVRVISDADTFNLVEQAPDTNGAGYYMVEDTTIKVVAGGAYSIHVEVGDYVLDAQTVGAGTTEILYQSADTIEYGGEFLIVRWQRDSLAAGYVALIDNLEPDWFEDSRAVSGNNGPDLVPWNIWAVPAADDALKLPWTALGFTGRHRLRLVTCDLNLWNYEWTYLPGNTQYNPVTNVRGGLGIFSVGDADTSCFMLTDTISDGPNGGG